MLLYDGVIQALASIELPPWIDECTCAILHGDLTLLLHLPAVFVILRLLLKILSEIVAGAPPSSHQEEVEPYRRYLTAFTDTEEDARLMLRRRSRYSNDRKQRDAELNNQKSPPGHETPDDEIVAARVIQRWVRTKFQPWMAVRRILRSPDLAANCTDRDAGAVEVTLVDHDFMSAIEQLSEHPLVEVEMAPDAPRLDLDVDGLIKLQKARALEEVVAARVIQRWFRATFQPWVLARNGRGSCPASRVAEWTDRYTGALVVTHVEDPDFMWTIEQSDELSLLDVSVADRVYEGTGVDGTNFRGSLRCREAATVSSTHVFPSRNHVDKFIA
ncbi:hypothetical protein MRX96_002377 [Rhipicephalus microplus]